VLDEGRGSLGMFREYLVEQVLVEESSTGSVGLCVVRDQCVEVFVGRDEIGKDQVPVIPDWDYMNCHYGFQAWENRNQNQALIPINAE